MVKHILAEIPERIPYNGTFELTIRCNLHCKMCLFRHNDSENEEIINKELTTKQWIDLARQASEAGTLFLLITGGEPMLREDFCEIWEGIYKLGFVTELYTNATLVSSKILETLKKYPPHKIGITIYGASAETYEKTCGSRKAFEKMIEGVHGLLTLPSNFEFRSTIIKDNFNDWEKIDDLVSSEFGTQYIVKQAAPINRAVRGSCSDVVQCRLDPDIDFRMKAIRKKRNIRRLLGDNCKNVKIEFSRVNKTSVVNNPNQQNSFFGCDAGISQYVITYNGEMQACQMIDLFTTDALHDGLKKAWDLFPTKVKYSNQNAKCNCCKYIEDCSACYGTRYAETGDLCSCSEYIYSAAVARNKYYSLSLLGGLEDE